jgi:hypothetical protein
MTIDFGTLNLNITLTVTDPIANQTLARIEHKLDALDTTIIQEKKQMAAIDDALDTLTAQVAQNTTVIGSAKVLINGFAAQLASAIAAAQAAGATPVQLQKMTDLQTAVKASDDDLAAAVAQGTPAANLP